MSVARGFTLIEVIVVLVVLGVVGAVTAVGLGRVDPDAGERPRKARLEAARLEAVREGRSVVVVGDTTHPAPTLLLPDGRMITTESAGGAP